MPVSVPTKEEFDALAVAAANTNKLTLQNSREIEILKATVAELAKLIANCCTKIKTAYYIPMYSSLMRQYAVSLVNDQANKDVLFYCTANPASGPGTSPRADITATLNDITKNPNVVALGYIPTTYGAKPINDILDMLTKYRNWYPQIKGIMFDEVKATSDQLTHYKVITDAARAQGFEYLKGNPGQKVSDKKFFEMFNSLTVFENSYLPDEFQITQAVEGQPKANTAFTVHSINAQALTVQYVEMLTKYFCMIYITNQTGNNEYGVPPDQSITDKAIGVLRK